MRTELPKKWCIYPPTDKPSQKLIHDYFNKGTKSKSYMETNSYFHFPNFGNGRGFKLYAHTSSDVRERYEVITFEEFQTLVLKGEQPEPIYEIY